MIKDFFEWLLGPTEDRNTPQLEIGDLGNPRIDKKKNDDVPFRESHKKFMFQLRRFQFYDFSTASAKDIYMLCEIFLNRMLESYLLYNNSVYIFRELNELKKFSQSNIQIHETLKKILHRSKIERHKLSQNEYRCLADIALYLRNDMDNIFRKVFS